MLWNYVKVAFRHLLRQKGFAVINTVGLAMGIASCLIVYLYVNFEMSYDNYHADLDRIFLVNQIQISEHSTDVDVVTPPALLPAIRENFPEVEYAARVLTMDTRLVTSDRSAFYEDRFILADPDLFNILTIPFIRGDAKSALERPSTVVISRRMAEKYFGSDNPIGRTVRLNTRDYEITGVVADSPPNTHLKYDFIGSLSSIQNEEAMASWWWQAYYTYIKLYPQADQDSFAAKLRHIGDKYAKEQFEASGLWYEYTMRPVKNLYISGFLSNGPEPAGNYSYLVIFSIIGLLVLAIACINYINLTTARSVRRAREVGLRKVVGADRLQLIRQFLGESLLAMLGATITAYLIVELTLPFFNSLAGIHLVLGDLFKPAALLAVVAVLLLVAMAAGGYPALVLAAFRPAATLKGTQNPAYGGSMLRKLLVVVQFAITIMLIVGTITVYQQLNYMRNKELGFAKEQKLIIPVRGGASVSDNYETVKAEFMRCPNITGATVSSYLPGEEFSSYSIGLLGQDDYKEQTMWHLFCDDDFIREYGLEIVAGRAFDKEKSTDIGGAFILNESAAQAFGFASADQAIGKRIKVGGGDREGEIVGIMKDFHYQGLQNSIQPLVLGFVPRAFDRISLTVRPENPTETIASARQIWQELFPGNPLEYYFLDANFNRQYMAEERIGRLLVLFASLGIFIACLGLFGLASYVVMSKTKEIGVRKVLGASVPGLVVMFAGDFTRWIIVANVIAWPVAYLAARYWLQGYAYRMEMSFGPFVFAALLALGVALATVSYQAIRAASTNPVEALKHE